MSIPVVHHQSPWISILVCHCINIKQFIISVPLIRKPVSEITRVCDELNLLSVMLVAESRSLSLPWFSSVEPKSNVIIQFCLFVFRLVCLDTLDCDCRHVASFIRKTNLVRISPVIPEICAYFFKNHGRQHLEFWQMGVFQRMRPLRMAILIRLQNFDSVP